VLSVVFALCRAVPGTTLRVLHSGTFPPNHRRVIGLRRDMVLVLVVNKWISVARTACRCGTAWAFPWRHRATARLIDSLDESAGISGNIKQAKGR